MYYVVSLLTGIMIAVMIFFNGGLTEQHGLHTSTVVIHIMGLIPIAALMLIKRENPFAKLQSWFFYLGGAIGVLTVIFTNFSYGRISVSAILALGLFGQAVASLIIDQHGWLGMPRHPFGKQKIAGLLLITGGIAVMTNRFDVAAVLTAFLAGANIVVSRTLNAKLAGLTSVRTSTFFNYLIGLTIAVPVLLLFGRGESVFTRIHFSPDVYIYFGGLVGVCIIFISNILVARVSALYLSLLFFIGQVFTGIVIDALISRSFPPRNLIGGALVTLGLCVNLWLDKAKKRPKTENEK
jgi:transporter family-2 protein